MLVRFLPNNDPSKYSNKQTDTTITFTEETITRGRVTFMPLLIKETGVDCGSLNNEDNNLSYMILHLFKFLL